jgi:hypothetical protein
VGFRDSFNRIDEQPGGPIKSRRFALARPADYHHHSIAERFELPQPPTHPSKTEFIITKIDIVEGGGENGVVVNYDDEAGDSGENRHRQSVHSGGASSSTSSDNTDESKLSRVKLIKQRLGIELESKVFNNMRNLRV